MAGEQGVDLSAVAHMQNREMEKVRKAIERAVRNPDEVIEYVQFGSGVVELEGLRKALVLGLPSGKQVRIQMDGANYRQIARELAEPHSNESSNGASSEASPSGEDPT